MSRGRVLLACAAAMLTVACASAPLGSRTAAHSAGTSSSSRPAATPQATPTPYPPYAIAALRERPHATGQITVKEQIDSGPGYTKYHVTWESGGSTMTGVLDIPSAGGRFPVVIVNHGASPVSQYYEGLDTAKYADPMASAGFLTIAPSYPGYLGSGPGAPGVTIVDAAAISDMDLISELPTLPQADPSRVAVAGHSQGGGVAEILMAADTRVRAAILYAPLSSDFADSARRYSRSPAGTPGVPTPAVNPAMYEQMSPRPWFNFATPPALIMQGTQDQDIPAEWTAATVQALQAVGATVKFISFAGANHFFEGDTLAQANSLAVDWLHTYLG